MTQTPTRGLDEVSFQRGVSIPLNGRLFLANLGNYPLGLFPTRLLVITSIVALVEIVGATLVGAWLYKEEEVVAQVVRRAAA